MDANKLLERATQASERGNYDYAVELFQQLLTVQPDNTDARRELRNVERRKVQENGGMNVGVKIAAGVKGVLPLAKVGIFSVLKSYERNMIECERYLKNDPDNHLMLATLAKCAEESNYLKTAVLVYEDLKAKYPDSLGPLRRLARLYQRLGEIDSASECFQKILTSKPTDEEAGKAVKDLAALKTMKEGKWDQAGKEGAYRQMLKDESKAVDLEQEQHVVRTDDDMALRIEKVKGDVEKDPRNVKILTQLGDLYARAGNREQARSVFKAIKGIDPRNLIADRKLADLDLADNQTVVDGIKEKLKTKPDDPALKQQLEAEENKLLQFRIAQLKSQSAAAPTDLGLRFKLGCALFENGETEAAVAQFQQASMDPKVRRDSNRMLGASFMRKSMYDMAEQFYEKALGEMSGTSNEGKDIIYHLGLCYEAQKSWDKAEKAYKRIMMVDIGFRDVSKRIESIGKQGSGAA